ncbi:MAG: hypothetical protein AAFV77_06165, partial [Planctomycetota bacterium]
MTTATIIDVLESWPLELRLRTQNNQTLHVSLSEDCRITQDGRALAPGSLEPGQVVVVQREPNGAIRSIEIR